MVTVRDVFERKNITTTGKVKEVRDVLERRYEREQTSHYERQATPIKQSNIEKINNYIKQIEKSIEDYRNRIKNYEEQRSKERDSRERKWYEDKIDEYRDEIRAREEALKVAKKELDNYEKLSDWRDILGFGESYADKLISYSKQIQYYEEAKAEESRRRQEWVRKFKESPEYQKLVEQYPSLKNTNVSYYELTKAIDKYNQQMKEAEKLSKEVKLYEIKEDGTQKGIGNVYTKQGLTSNLIFNIKGELIGVEDKIKGISRQPTYGEKLFYEAQRKIETAPMKIYKSDILPEKSDFAKFFEKEIKLPEIQKPHPVLASQQTTIMKQEKSKIPLTTPLVSAATEEPKSKLTPVYIKGFKEIIEDVKRAPTLKDAFKAAYSSVYSKISQKSILDITEKGEVKGRGEKWLGEAEEISKKQAKELTTEELLKKADWKIGDFISEDSNMRSLSPKAYSYALSEKFGEELLNKYYSDRKNFVEEIKNKNIPTEEKISEARSDFYEWLRKEGRTTYNNYLKKLDEVGYSYTKKKETIKAVKLAIPIAIASGGIGYGFSLLSATSATAGAIISTASTILGAGFAGAYSISSINKVMDLRERGMLSVENVAKAFAPDLIYLSSTFAGGYIGSRLGSEKILSYQKEFLKDTTKKLITDSNFRSKYLTEQNIKKGYIEIEYKKGLLKYDFKYPLTKSVVDNVNFLHQVYKEGGLKAKPLQATKYIGVSEREKTLILDSLKAAFDREFFQYDANTIKKIAQTQVTPKLNIPHSKTKYWYSIGGTIRGKYVEVLFQLTSTGKPYNYHIINKIPFPNDNRIALVHIGKVISGVEREKIGGYILEKGRVKYLGSRIVITKQAGDSVLANSNIVLKKYDVLSREFFGIDKINSKQIFADFTYTKKIPFVIKITKRGMIEKGSLEVAETPFNFDFFKGKSLEVDKRLLSTGDLKVKPSAAKKTLFAKTFESEMKKIGEGFSFKAKQPLLKSKQESILDLKEITVAPKSAGVKVKGKPEQKQVIKPFAFSEVKIREKEKILEKEVNDIANRTLAKQAQIEKAIPLEKQAQIGKQLTIPTIRERVIEKQGELLKQAQKQALKIKEPRISENVFLLGAPSKKGSSFISQLPKIRPITIKLPKLKITLTKSKVKPAAKEKEKKAYVPQIRRKGKWLDISESLDSFEAAFSLGKQKVKKTLAASFRVVEKKEAPKKKALAWGLILNDNEFYKKIEETPVYIQKKEKRLSSKEEVSEIQRARKKSELNERYWLR